jgi:pimeloyl-ACP methyl ester carboxylesterase
LARPRTPRPSLRHVGTGQVTNFAQNEKAAYDDALQQARTHHNAQAIKELEAIAPYPRPNLSDAAVGVAKGWEQRLLGPPPGVPDFTDGSRIIKTLVSTPEYSLVDDVDFIRGMNSSRAVLPEVMQVDLTRLGLDFQVPIFFFEGKFDPYCRPSLISDYFQTIHDPQKQLVWFDRSGHFPFFEEPQKFTDSLVHLVLPLASKTTNPGNFVGCALHLIRKCLVV